jgi:hypothetical protein
VQVDRSVDAVNSFSGGVRTMIFHGSHYRAEVRLSSGELLDVVLPPTSDLHEGAEVEVGWEAEETHLFQLNEELSLPSEGERESRYSD